MKRSLLSLSVGAVLAASAGLAQADVKGVTIGTLECHEASGMGLVWVPRSFTTRARSTDTAWI
jgi:hypothetical protein